MLVVHSRDLIDGTIEDLTANTSRLPVHDVGLGLVRLVAPHLVLILRLNQALHLGLIDLAENDASLCLPDVRNTRRSVVQIAQSSCGLG